MTNRFVLAVLCLTVAACGEGVTDAATEEQVLSSQRQKLDLGNIRSVMDPNACWSTASPLVIAYCQTAYAGDFYIDDIPSYGADGRDYFRFSRDPLIRHSCLEVSGSTVSLRPCTSLPNQKFSTTWFTTSNNLSGYQLRNMNGLCLTNYMGRVIASWCKAPADASQLWIQF